RRHTRSKRDWSSDVCSSDLDGLADEALEDAELLGVLLGGGRHLAGDLPLAALVDEHRGVATVVEDHVRPLATGPGEDGVGAVPRSEERRVGKEWSCSIGQND